VRRGLLVLALLLSSPGTAFAATSLTLSVNPASPLYGSTATFSGAITPAAAGATVELWADTGGGESLVTSTTTAADGSYSIPLVMNAGATFRTKTAGATSPDVVVNLRPQITAVLSGLRYVGSRLLLKGRLTPATAGTLTLHLGAQSSAVAVAPDGRFRSPLPTRRATTYTAKLDFAPGPGFAAREIVRSYRVRAPYLSLGASGTAVIALERLLYARHYALRGVNRYFGFDTYEAVLAFQKVHRLSRTGRVASWLWPKIANSGVPHARIAMGSHVEVDKTRQVLFEVRSGKVTRIVHVSTGATGNTPVGRWHFYLKTPGLNSHGMYYSNYFLRGFAVHGYASVPPYPASHGCVRTPMWFARGFYSRWHVGDTIYVFA
jgi:L,D-transpeptidase catalytic domain/Putative peptidoglycan binding domain